MLWYCILLTYQTIVGDLAYLTRFDVLYPLSTVSQKTHCLLQYARLCRGDTNCAIYICQPWPSKPLFFILELIPSANQRISYLMSLYRYLSVQTHRIEKQDVQRKRETKLGALLICFLFIMLRSKLYPGWKTPLCLVRHQQSAMGWTNWFFRNFGQMILEGDNESVESL